VRGVRVTAIVVFYRVRYRVCARNLEPLQMVTVSASIHYRIDKPLRVELSGVTTALEAAETSKARRTEA
jgi:hypothetical protein